MSRRRGLLFVISAPSGAGKTSLCRALTDSMENLTHSVSYTTRKPRPLEIDGRDYSFVSEERFREMVQNGDFAEWAQVHGNLYGTSRRVLESMAQDGVDVILDIDTQGARQIREKFPRAVFVFIMPPSVSVLEERLRNRKSDSEEEIARRLRKAKDEISEFGNYEYIIVNRDFDRALAELRAIVTGQRCRTELLEQGWIDDMIR